jgi:prevent-host-death family protein
MSTESLQSARDHLSELVDRVEHHHERVIVTRYGHAAAVLISPDDLAQMEETIDVLSDSSAFPTSGKLTPPTPAVMSSAASTQSVAFRGDGGPDESDLSRHRGLAFDTHPAGGAAGFILARDHA